jgi:hypothetical protein
MDKKIIKWINKDLDGVLSTGKKKKLEVVLEKNISAKQYHQNLKTASLLLEKLPRVEPPQDLKIRIQNSLNPDLYSTKIRPSRSSSAPRIHLRANAKWIVAFAAGVVITVIVVLLYQSGLTIKKDMNITDLYGTVGIRENIGFKIRESIPIDHPSITGTVFKRQSHQLLGLEFNLKTSMQTDLWIEFNPQHVNFTGLKPLNTIKLSLENNTHYVKTTIRDENHFILLFQKLTSDTSRFSMKLMQTNNVLIKKEITAGKKG